MTHIPTASTSTSEHTMTNARWADYFEANRDREARFLEVLRNTIGHKEIPFSRSQSALSG